MIKNITCQVTIVSKQLRSSAIVFPIGITIISKVERGDIISFGRNKGKTSEETFVIFEGEIDCILNYIAADLIPEFGLSIDELNITILVVYIDQCNFELTVNQLNKIVSLNIPLSITCYNEDNI